MNFINGQTADTDVKIIFDKKQGVLQNLPIYPKPNSIAKASAFASYDSATIQEFLKGSGIVQINGQRQDYLRVASTFHTEAFVEKSDVLHISNAQEKMSIYNTQEMLAIGALRDKMSTALFTSSPTEYFNTSFYGLQYNSIDKTGDDDEGAVVWVAWANPNGVYGFTGTEGFIKSDSAWESARAYSSTRSQEIKGFSKDFYGVLGVQNVHPLSLWRISLASGATGATIKAGIDEARGYILDEAQGSKAEVQIYLKNAENMALASAGGNTYVPGDNLKASYTMYDGSMLIEDGYIA